MAKSCKVGRNKQQSEVPETGPGEAAGELGPFTFHSVWRTIVIMTTTACGELS